MSQNQPKAPTAAPVAEVITDLKDKAEEVLDTKPTRRQRARAFVSKHKQPLIASAAMISLVGGSAYLGRKTAHTSLDFHAPLEIEYTSVEEAEEALAAQDEKSN